MLRMECGRCKGKWVKAWVLAAVVTALSRSGFEHGISFVDKQNVTHSRCHDDAVLHNLGGDSLDIRSTLLVLGSHRRHWNSFGAIVDGVGWRSRTFLANHGF